MDYIIMCRSLTYAQRAVRVLERVGIIASIARAPQGISSQGCAYSVKMSERRLSEALGIIKNAGLNPGRVYKLDSNGTTSEVFL